MSRQPPTQTDPAVEYATFLIPDFDPNEFAHSIVNNVTYPGQLSTPDGVPATPAGFMKGFIRGSDEGGDVSAALARLNFGVEELSRQLKSEVTKHHSSLLLHAASLGGLENDLHEVRRGLSEVESGVNRLKKKITVPHDSLASSLVLLMRLRRITSLARRCSRFTVLVKRLEGQMNDANTSNSNGASGEIEKDRKERALTEAALTLAELDLLLNEGEDEVSSSDDPEAILPIKSVTVVASSVTIVELSRQRVVEEIDSMIMKGMSELNHPLLSLGLQISHNLAILPSVVETLVADFVDLILKKIKLTFDMASLAREISGKDHNPAVSSGFVYKSRARNEPTAATLPQWTSAMWSRLSHLISDLGNLCNKAYLLEKILILKKDPATQTSFLDEALSSIESSPSAIFWSALTSHLEAHVTESAKNSTFIQNLFSTGYPRLLRLFHEFFATISVYSDTSYTTNQQSPELVSLLKSVSSLETLYVQRSNSKLNEAVNAAFSMTSSIAAFTGRPPAVPSANEGLATARTIANEIDAARFDPLLAKTAALNASKTIELFMNRATGFVQRDVSAISALGPTATAAQHCNADLTSALYHLWYSLTSLFGDYSESVKEILRTPIENVRIAYMAIYQPLINSIRREISTTINRMHRTDYSRKDAAPNTLASMGNSTSSYMADLTERLSFIKDELFAIYRVGDLIRDWVLELAKFTVQTFILHASIIRCPSEAGKLKLTADTTALEFSISQLLSAHGLALSSMGDQFKALRSFRPLLFLDNSQLTSPVHTGDAPTLVLLHHIISRSSLYFPHELKNWSESEYVRWLNENLDSERIGAVSEVLQDWETKQDETNETDKLLVDAIRQVVDSRIS